MSTDNHINSPIRIKMVHVTSSIRKDRSDRDTWLKTLQFSSTGKERFVKSFLFDLSESNIPVQVPSRAGGIRRFRNIPAAQKNRPDNTFCCRS